MKYDVSYQGALAAAGAKVLAYKEFGSYQGDWYAKIEHGGEIAFIHGSYGSCSGCDAIQAEFDYGPDRCEEHRYDWDNEHSGNCDACKTATADAEKRFEQFGANYLNDKFTYEQAIAEASRYIEWDGDAQTAVEWLKSLQP